jgi:hypothetical protein
MGGRVSPLPQVGREPSVPVERSSLDDVIDRYKRDVDRTLLRQALELSPAERVAKMIELSHFAGELRAAAERAGW